MGKTLLKMQMSITIMVLDRKGDKEGREKQTRSCAGNVVQVFGFKNNFPREAGYHGISRKLPLPPEKDLKTPNPNFCKLQLCDTINDQSSRGRRMNVSSFSYSWQHSLFSCWRISINHGSTRSILKDRGRKALNILPVYISNRASWLGKFSKQ